MPADDELLLSFIAESRDMLDEVEPTLIELQQNSEETGNVDAETLNSIFRLFHSMKGSAGFLNLTNISGLTHEAETLLNLFREGKAELQLEHTEIFCRALDMMRELMDHVEAEATDAGYEAQTEALAGELKQAIEAIEGGGKAPAPAPAPESAAPAPPPAGCSTAPPLPKVEAIEDPVALTRKINDLLVAAEKAPESARDGEELDLLAAFMKGLAELSEAKEWDDLAKLARRAYGGLQTLRAGDAPANAETLGVLLRIHEVALEAVDAMGDKAPEVVAAEVYIDLMDDTFPAPPAEGGVEGAAPAADAGGAGDATGPHVLAIDDEEPVLDVVRAILGRANYRVSGRTDPEDALTFLQGPESGDVEIVLSDFSMPQMDGLEFIKAVRKIKPDLPVMVLTGYGDKELLVKLLEVGVDEFLDKPFKEEVLLQKVKAALQKFQNLQAAKERQEEALAPKREKRMVARQDIRVDLDKLDLLINLVGELVIAESMVTRNPELKRLDLDLENFERAAHHLRRITSELQDIAMSVRMIPLSATFRKMIRLVHEVSKKAGKSIRLDLVGEETDVDKTVIEQIADPLVHMIRNSCDHGVEPPEERRAAGKPEQGVVVLEARHEGGEVWILIRDDGRGLHRDKILARAISRGLVEGDGSDLTDQQVFKLIFEPGFSTAEKITDISGRGVGMDVVKKNIEKLNGRVEIQSKVGEGSIFIIHIPLTLAIIDGMLVRVGDATYIIPTLSIRESFRPDPGTVHVTPDGQEVARVRDLLIPVVRLHELYNCPEAYADLHQAILITVEAHNEPYCLMVDEILGQQETVIKGLSDYIGNAPGVSGCTILGNGDVSLILDVTSLIEAARRRFQLGEAVSAEDEAAVLQGEIR